MVLSNKENSLGDWAARSDWAVFEHSREQCTTCKLRLYGKEKALWCPINGCSLTPRSTPLPGTQIFRIWREQFIKKPNGKE